MAVTEIKADANAAWVTSRLEFYRQPDWMAQFPFAHTIEMTYRLEDGTLEVHTVLHNLSAEPMPVSIGFHPLLQVNDAPRDEWTFSIGARTHWILTPQNIPTGETQPHRAIPAQPAERFAQRTESRPCLQRPDPGCVRQRHHVAPGQVREGGSDIGPELQGGGRLFTEPEPGNNFICFEPMAGITDALNLAQKGVYKELQYIPPGQNVAGELLDQAERILTFGLG